MNNAHDAATRPSIQTADTLPAEATRRGQDADQQMTRVLRRHSESVLPALLRRDEHRLVREHQTAELAMGFEHRRAALEMVLESRLQSVREACNHVLMTGKASLREQRLQYFGQVYAQLEQRMQRLADEFVSEADRRYAALERIQAPHLRDRERARQEKAAASFLDTLDQLMDEFRAILGEAVKVRGGAGEGRGY